MRLTLTHGLPARAAWAAFVLAQILAARCYAQDAVAAPPSTADPFVRHAWHLELGGLGATEAVNFNGSHEYMAALYEGITYGVSDGVVARVGSPLYYVWQRGTDGYLFGLTGGFRGRILRRPRWTLFWDIDVGMSESDTYVPPGGTRFNFLAAWGGGVSLRMRPGTHALAGARWIHVSNNNFAGRSRNPDIEAFALTAGLLIAF
jgi:hypothetical protein